MVRTEWRLARRCSAELAVPASAHATLHLVTHDTRRPRTLALADQRPLNRGLDDVDRQILSLLVADARLSNRELARRVGMSPGATSERLDRLESSGAILGYHAAVSPHALGLGTSAIIGLQVTQGHPVDQTMASLYELPEVRSVALVTGQWDFMVEVQVRDQAHLREVLINHIWELPVFRHSETLMILDRLERQPSWFAEM